MTWPELEVALSEQEYFDLLDEFADEPQSLPPGIRALGAAGTGARAPEDRPGPATFTETATVTPLPVAATPRACLGGPTSRAQQRDARGVHLLSCQCVTCDRGRQWLDGRSCTLEAE